MRPRTLGLALLLAAALALSAGEARAGGGPETTVVVVNADSPSSLRLANEYVRLRRIPASHVCRIPGVGTLSVVDVENNGTDPPVGVVSLASPEVSGDRFM